MSPIDSAKALLRVKINQIASLINPSTSLKVKGLILEATHRVSVHSVVVAHAGTAAIEAEAARESAANRTAPIAAEGTATVERTVAAAVARHGQFKR